ncbi:hypothetical protein B0A48_13246 [Cryoendolithus antarcticus]|uniref:DUF221-domain-containing protein n=1 Tax=Cryoendolithus antarcticus TaxID=1507870 RepID=A0A1V8SNL9_9PEZI|nr:hypothetical protein B0A48_13246 [Cryoendolithus antarcticus]
MTANSTNSTGITDIFNGNAGVAQNNGGIATKSFVLNLATGVALFTFQFSGFLLLKNSNLGRRLYQPKTYLVQDRLRVEAIPVSPLAWIKRIFTIKGEELKAKCGLDGYFAIRFLRAMVIIFVPLMVICVIILLPVNYHGGRNDRSFEIGGQSQQFNITGLDTLSWQNVAPTKTNRYWAHLVCALVVIVWTLWRIYREKLHFITTRQDYLTSPEQRIKASARTILVTNIPSEYRSTGALEALYDVYVDNDDRSKLHVWLNRDYTPLRTLVSRRRKLHHALEKEELKMQRLVNKQLEGAQRHLDSDRSREGRADDDVAGEQAIEGSTAEVHKSKEGKDLDTAERIRDAFEEDIADHDQIWRKHLKDKKETHIQIMQDERGVWQPVSSLKSWQRKHRRVPKIAWLRAEIARLTMEIEELMPKLDDEAIFKPQNSAFIQFDRQMAANMACALVTHHAPGTMNPRFLHVAPHEVLWPNMGLTSLARFVRTLIAMVLFAGMLILWAIPAFFLSILSQLEILRSNTSWLEWLRRWPTWIIGLISGPLVAILLALLVQLVVPALCRKLAVLCGAPTRSRREVTTQAFYFTFLIIELVLVTSISSGLLAVLPIIFQDPTSLPETLATNLPKAANYFFNYLIIQALGFSGSALFQYLRILFINLIWPWFTQTPRQEAWLQTVIPHQMWANVFSLWTNFAAIGLIYSIIAPLMLLFVSAVFALFWVAYRHNYYFVQRNKVDTYGALFENALTQLLAGIYILEITLIGLFFLVRNSDDNLAATSQAIIMIVALILTAGFHYLHERLLSPLYELLPVTLEDKAADAERKMYLTEFEDGAESGESEGTTVADPECPSLQHRRAGETSYNNPAQLDGTTTTQRLRLAHGVANTAAEARKTMLRLRERMDLHLAAVQSHGSSPTHTTISPTRAHKMQIADQLGASIASYPDELTDLSPAERDAELRAAYQDPVTREPAPMVWIPQDAAGVGEDAVRRSRKYGRLLQYSDQGAYLTMKGKVEVVQPAPDVRGDWLLDWNL